MQRPAIEWNCSTIIFASLAHCACSSIVAESSPDGVLGLYEGATALHAGEGMPERITLYKRPHEAAARNHDDLVAEVRRTILHEVGHHFGMEEEELPY